MSAKTLMIQSVRITRGLDERNNILWISNNSHNINYWDKFFNKKTTWFNGLGDSRKMIIGYIIVILITLISLAFTIKQYRSLKQKLKEVKNKWIKKLEYQLKDIYYIF